ncbi:MULTISPECIES: LuxR C-terminal-related transcriptional regulator [unclassified Amycolatopsis]|uniref:LuxR C-terminal-related transcriptional regulator n=1 Tax=unclassified Amycolatopsis TaxID=2618356 RepID=UPI001EE7E9BA|nr:LuxR C-terminal-related transcriptional regulator [Amycolatopsis sp. Poz14]MCG3754518.1 GAF domain-containing protein [Amycolatopsis sp. Poz14]
MNATGFPRLDSVRLDAGLAEEVRALGRDAGAALDRMLPVGRCAEVLPAKRLLGQVWDATMAELGSAPAPERLPGLTALLARVRDLESRVDDARVADGVATMRRVRRALTRLHACPTADEVLSRAAEEACTIGFDRVLVSTVDDATWMLRRMVIEQDPRLAAEMLAAGREAPPRLDGSLVESDVVHQARAGLVYDVQENPRVNRQLVSMSGCTSYAVAPLQAYGKVVGLLHADSYYSPRREVDATDRAVLNLYAEGVSETLARVSVLEGLASLQQGMSRLAADVRIGPPPPGPAPHPLLSAREAEVIDLMARGDANRAIARKLSISEGTVKTHITHILRKLDAANRAEAVAYWLRNC